MNSGYRALVNLNGVFNNWDEFSEKLESLLGEYGENCTYSKVLINNHGEELTIFENKNETNVLGYYKSDGPITESRLG